MRIAMFYHSLVSDWNHGNAHFLRGIASELLSRGHDVCIYEPENGWSRENLLRDHGTPAIDRFHSAFPRLRSTVYSPATLDIDGILEDVDLALVHEWNDPFLVAAVGRTRRRSRNLRILFHDTHHRAVTAMHELNQFDLAEYDGVLAYGGSLKAAYEHLGWGSQVHVWHEAADIRVFYPRPAASKSGDLVWIGNWGDEERSEELREYFIEPVKRLAARAEVYGVRYPNSARTELQNASISYRGWIPNFDVPEVFSRFRATVHVPRRPYTRQLPGIPTIRPFEALACGIPLVSAPWSDTEGLFRSGKDFLMARNADEMEEGLRDVLGDSALARSLRDNGLETIRSRHTCAHRVDELLNIYENFRPGITLQKSKDTVEVHA